MSDEPLLKEALKSAIGAVIALLVAIGIPIDDQLQTALIGLIPTIALIYTLWKGRQQVVPVDKANKQIEKVAKQDATFNTEKIKELKFKKGS